MSLSFVRPLAPAFLPALLALAGVPLPAAAQVEFTLQGGMHLNPAAVPGYALEQSAGRPAGGRAAVGEATTAGARVGLDLSERWVLDGGVAWSRSTSRDGAVGQPVPPVGSSSLFVSSTVQARLTDPGARLLLVGGVGPALIFERGDGTRATRRTNVGGVATLAGVLRLDTRLSLRLDAQQYWFSAPIGDSYTPHLGTTPVRPSDATLRHDFVLLAGISWRTD